MWEISECKDSIKTIKIDLENLNKAVEQLKIKAEK